MKKLLIILLVLLLLISQCHAGLFSSNEPELAEHKQKLAQIETQLHTQRQITDTWAMAAGVLGIGSVLLFLLGAALGSKTRRHAILH